MRLAALALVLAACSSNAPAQSTTAATSSAPKLRLGHYSSGDGLVGFVLDRTGAAPKLKMDGTNEVLVLEVERWGSDSNALVNHDKHIGIIVDNDGGVTYSKKGVNPNKPMFRDADAQPL